MLYKSLKFIFSTALHVFFKEYKVINKTEIPTTGPLILVSNHPSSFMDPIILASLVEQEVHFIAKGTLFNSVAKDWVMRNIMNAIPIYRKADNPGQKLDNDAVFEQCFQFLEKKGTLIIFPEGTSIIERKLQDIKTGTARIALGAEARNDFELDVKILSVGINYSDAPSFQSDVWINVEELIHVKDYRQEYHEDDRAAVRELTEKIQSNLEKNLIITADEQEDQFIKNVEAIYKNELMSDLKLDPQLHSFNLTKGIEVAIDHFEDLDKNWLDNLKQKVADYTRRLNNYNLKDEFLAKKKNKRNSNFFLDTIFRLLYIIIGFPFFVYGLITNYIPYILPSKIATSLTNFVEYDGPVKMTVGIFTFVSYYSFLIYIFERFISQGNWWWTNMFTASLPIAGFFALHYAQRFKNFKTHTKLLSLFYKEPEVVGELLLERKAIIKEFDWAKEEWMKLSQGV